MKLIKNEEINLSQVTLVGIRATTRLWTPDSAVDESRNAVSIATFTTVDGADENAGFANRQELDEYLKRSEYKRPGFYIMLAGPALEVFVFLGECPPSEAFTDIALSGSLILETLARQGWGEDAVTELLETCLSCAGSLEVRAVPDGICFTIEVGSYRVARTVPSESVSNFFLVEEPTAGS